MLDVHAVRIESGSDVLESSSKVFGVSLDD
jgi:hypothetical protein